MAQFFSWCDVCWSFSFLLIIGITTLKLSLKLLGKLRLNFRFILILFIFLLSLNYFFTNRINVPYLGNFDKITDIDRILIKTYHSTAGDASWPKWTIINSFDELFYKVPIRSIYFLFSPFPWEIKKVEHLIGMLDSLLYIYLSFLIYQNRKIIWKDQTLRTLLLILLFYILVFSIGVGNFGTGIRHRSKFVFIFIILAAPLLRRVIFKKKNKF